MWHKTKVTELLNLQYPIVQGPFGGGVSSAKLVSVVSNAGGMGSYGAYQLQPQEIISLDKDIRSLTGKPYALNLWVSDADPQTREYNAGKFEKTRKIFRPFFDEMNIPLPEIPEIKESKFENQAEAILKIKPPAFSFVFGIPSKEIISACKRQKIKTIGTATTLDEAIALEEAEVDLIVATGFEAGGHRPSFLRPAKDSLTGTFVLIPLLANKIKTPIIAAGGIADGRGIAAALTLGASAVQIGTAFLACEESNAPKEHKRVIFSKEAGNTVLTQSFTGRLARGTRSRISEVLEKMDIEFPPFPVQSLFLNPLRAAAIAQNKTDYLTFWAGQAAPIVTQTSAAKLMQSLVSEVDIIYNKRQDK